MRQYIDVILGRIVVIVMSLLVIDVLLQVATGFFFSESNPFTFTGELAEFLLIWVGLLGAAYASGKKQHLAIQIMNNRMSDIRRKRLSILVNFLILLFAVLILIIGGSRFVIINIKLEQISSAIRIPMWYVYTVLPLSGLFISYYAVDDIFKAGGSQIAVK